ncbi:helix-turn-helix domain-containing protein [Lentzea sp. PSKA42]|jgi:transcriptional regulator with XRE-family HTH domain|uniref:Helix-turn-helix domain-containing protein n=1 Tax=Lentzea indica TaxID=2604800 RepID=A0ABX1FS07_9PSEU|nr:helix-turn-helix transcriptional regulator [Lentzea indica]NKE61436.1 helix-turn-helix domain-containing protein [Lentzea indica]
MPKRFSSVVSRSFGDGVRDAIQSTGMTQRRIAELLGWEQAKVSDLVKGKGGVTEVELAMLLGLCNVKPDEARRLLALYNESREKGYLEFAEDGVLSPQPTLMEQERHANNIVVWSLNLIPGLLQIDAYIRAACERSVLGADPLVVEAVIKTKLARQAVFHRSREFVFYIHEHALRLPVGGEEVMKAQLLHLLTMTVRPYLAVRIVPIAVGAHAGVAGSFTRLRYEKFEPVIFVEGGRTGLFLEDKDSVTYYDAVVERLDQLALDEEESKALITSIVS